MRASVDWNLIDKIRYDAKMRKFSKRMADCMDEDDVISCAELIAKVLQFLPEHLKERLIDKLIQTIDSVGERYGR